MQPRLVLSCVAFVSASFSMAEMASSFESIKHKLVGGPYAGAGGMAIGAGSVGVEEFADDAEAISAIRMFPDVMRSFGGLGPGATDAEVAAIFLPALKVMLPHGGYFHDTLYGIRVTDENTVTMQTGDMQHCPSQRSVLGRSQGGQPRADDNARPSRQGRDGSAWCGEVGVAHEASLGRGDVARLGEEAQTRGLTVGAHLPTRTLRYFRGRIGVVCHVVRWNISVGGVCARRVPFLVRAG